MFDIPKKGMEIGGEFFMGYLMGGGIRQSDIMRLKALMMDVQEALDNGDEDLERQLKTTAQQWGKVAAERFKFPVKLVIGGIETALALRNMRQATRREP